MGGRIPNRQNAFSYPMLGSFSHGSKSSIGSDRGHQYRPQSITNENKKLAKRVKPKSWLAMERGRWCCTHTLMEERSGDDRDRAVFVRNMLIYSTTYDDTKSTPRLRSRLCLLATGRTSGSPGSNRTGRPS